MRLSASRTIALPLCLFLALLIGPVVAAGLQGDSTAGGQKVRIEIDARGIRVERAAESGAEEFESDEDTLPPRGRPYRQKGTDIVRFGQDVHVRADEVVSGDLVVFGADALVEGKVTGDVVVLGGDIELGPEAEINGDAVVMGGTMREDPDAVIRGERVTFNAFRPLLRFGGIMGVGLGWVRLSLVVVKFLLSFLLSCLVYLLASRRMGVMKDSLDGDYLRSLGVGFLVGLAALVVLPVATLVLALVLFVTIIGIPLAVALMMAVAAGAFVAMVVAIALFSFHLGERMRERMSIEGNRPYLSIFLGSLVLFLPLMVGAAVSVIPFFFPVGLVIRLMGKFFIVFATAAGLGAMVRTRMGRALPPAGPGEEAAVQV